LSEDERLQRAVSLTIAAGYQLDKEAFEFLGVKSSKHNPISLVEEAIRKMEGLPEKPLFLDQSLLEEIIKETFPEKEKTSSPTSSQPILERRRISRPYAKDIDADVSVIEDPTDKLCTTGSVEEYLEYFQDRFERIEKILRKRMDAKDSMSITEALKSSVNSKVKIIGMVTEKREFNQKIFLTLEDLKASVTVLVPQNVGREVIMKARALLPDQLVCVMAVRGRNDLLIAENLIWPDVPRKTPQKATIPVYAALISDLHVGNKVFMDKEFNRFVLWLNGKLGNEKLREIASHIKYVVIAGDLVDGIGVYPGQVKELETRDIYDQYRTVSKIIEQIPDYIELIIIPGNHDASRKALPQPAIPKGYAEPLYEARKLHSLGNPCTVNLHGVDLLLYHGRSLDDVVAVVPDVMFQTPEKAMKSLLQSRHLAPIYGKRTPIAPEKRDYMVIEKVPDIFHAGHVHVVKHNTYRGILIVNSGAWQKQTEYQRKMGLVPTPGIAPIVNLQTLQVTPINFTVPHKPLIMQQV
jgi:DNA polymerase II small subunit